MGKEVPKEEEKPKEEIIVEQIKEKGESWYFRKAKK